MKNVIVTTIHKGVFFGQVAEDDNLDASTMRLENARCAIYFATTGGVAELAEKGPNENSRIGSRATIESLRDITAVWAVTDAAAEVWLSI